jgi:serine/threonine protein kinase
VRQSRHGIKLNRPIATTSRQLPATQEIKRKRRIRPLHRKATRPASINQRARNLILRLLSQHASQRPSMHDLARHNFFEQAGTGAFLSLYRQPSRRLGADDISPVADTQWSCQQFSSIWALQPLVYDICVNIDDMPLSIKVASSGPIQEGEEASAFFSLPRRSHCRLVD